MRRASPQSGQSLVEFGLLLGLFLALLLGVFDWAWTMFMHQTLTSRAAMAARWAAVHSKDGMQSGVRDIVVCGRTPCPAGASAPFGLKADNVAASVVDKTYTVSSAEPVTTSHVVVTISGYTVQHFTPLLGSSFSGRTITASHEWECLYDDCRAP